MPKDRPEQSEKRNQTEDDDILEEARKRFAAAEDGWAEVKAQALDDLNFGRLAQQWPMDIVQSRKAEGRPCLTINRLPAFIRQVVNDGRQNRPQIKVRPVDSGADVHTADVIGGLIKHIEVISDADVAYDTALDNACSMGFGFMGAEIDYACDDTFDMDLKIKAYPNPLAISWDPYTEAADSSDWDFAFVSELIPDDRFDDEYPNLENSADLSNDQHLQPWYSEGCVRRSVYYERVQDKRQVYLLSDGSIVDKDAFTKPIDKDQPTMQEMLAMLGIVPTREREVRSYRIVKRLITGKNVLEEKTWRGSIIPVVPVYGEQINVEGRRYFYSLIRDAKDSQRVFNYSRSAATEMVALAPKVPYIGPKGAFKTDIEKWQNANQKSHAFIEYDGAVSPARQQFGGIPEGPLSEAAGALEDMKQIIGISNPALGMPDTRVISGKAKQMERFESDTSTFHFVDNQHRGIRCLARVLIELIPQVYSGQRVVRIIGQDGKPSSVPLKQPVQQPDGSSRIYDLSAGKYDVAVEAGPSYATQREETQDWVTSFIAAMPAAAPILGPVAVGMSDFPNSDKITKALETMMPPAAYAALHGLPPPPPNNTPPPEVQAKMAQAQADQQIQQQKAQADMALSHQKATQDFQLEQQAAQNRAQIEQTQAQADIATTQQKAAVEMQIERERAALQMQLKREEAQLAMELKAMDASRAAQQTADPGAI